VLLIGLDAAERSLIECWTSEGHLPTLARLLREGSFGAIESEAALFAGGVWPSFYTARRVPWHGIYHNKLWRHDRMRCEIAHESWLPERPFWEWVEPRLRVTIVDVPMTLRRPRTGSTTQLAGFGTHDLVAAGSWPPELWESCRRTYGRPSMPAERFGPQTPATLLRLREDLLRTTRQIEAITVDLLDRDPWDLFVVVASALHRGGHYLWDLSQIDTSSVSTETRRVLEGALLDLYRAADAFVDRCLRGAPDARVLVFAVHGMGPNRGWADRCADLVGALHRGSAGGAPKSGLVYRIKRRLPWNLVREVTTRLPRAATDRLVELWSSRMFDWSTTKAFPLPMDAAGYVRFNVRGREPRGVVDDGPELRALVEEWKASFAGIRDRTTGRPIVRRVWSPEDLGAGTAPYRDGLPDLIVEWDDLPATACAAVISDRFGELAWTNPTKLPSGRAGNHRSSGWFVAWGDGVPAGRRIDGAHAIDLVPTVLSWLGEEVPPEAQGRPIPALLHGPREPDPLAPC
jgi:predicted AlkP superfamily phosphohydrolase/phosphomutase